MSSINPTVRRYPPHRVDEDHPVEMSGRPSSTLDLLARILIWAALGWTVGMLILLLFIVKIDGETLIHQYGWIAPALALIPIAIISLPLIGIVSKKVRRITPVVAGVTAVLVLLSIVVAGGFFIPAAFALGAAALLEVADSGTPEA